jgi:hypothetical protein
MRVVGPIACLLTVVAASTAGPANAAPATCGKLLAPTNGLYLGGAPDFVSNPRRLEGDTVTKAAIDVFQADVGHSTVWSEMAQHWFLGLGFPADKVRTAWQANQIPFIRMFAHAGSPYGVDNPPEQFPGDYSLENIAGGRFDAGLKAWADAARDTNIPILLEFGVEENNDWGPWAGDWNGAGQTSFGDPALPDGPERFRLAFRHLVGLFRAEGASNVTWFFHVDSWYQPRAWWDTYANYYPGDDVVDWVALSVYGWEGTGPNNGIPTFEQKLQTYTGAGYVGSYADIAGVSSRPIALAEVAAPSGTPQQRADWITGMFATLASGRYPRIAEMTWWNSTDIGTRIDLHPETKAAFRAGVAGPVFAAKPQVAGTCTPAKPRVSRKGRLLTWTTLPNAAWYEVWRNGKRVATPLLPQYKGASGKYKVRGVNVLGAGPFG